MRFLRYSSFSSSKSDGFFFFLRGTNPSFLSVPYVQDSCPLWVVHVDDACFHCGNPLRTRPAARSMYHRVRVCGVPDGNYFVVQQILFLPKFLPFIVYDKQDRYETGKASALPILKCLEPSQGGIIIFPFFCFYIIRLLVVLVRQNFTVFAFLSCYSP